MFVSVLQMSLHNARSGRQKKPTTSPTAPLVDYRLLTSVKIGVWQHLAAFRLGIYAIGIVVGCHCMACFPCPVFAAPRGCRRKYSVKQFKSWQRINAMKMYRCICALQRIPCQQPQPSTGSATCPDNPEGQPKDRLT